MSALDGLLSGTSFQRCYRHRRYDHRRPTYVLRKYFGTPPLLLGCALPLYFPRRKTFLFKHQAQNNHATFRTCQTLIFPYSQPVFFTCGELGIGFVAFSPMASGFLSGKYQKTDVYTGDDVRRVITRFAPENMEANQPLLEMLHDIAATKGATPAQISLAWMLHKYSFVVPIPGMRKEERLKENFGAAEITLTEKEFDEIEKALSNITIHGNRTDEDIAKLRE